MLARVVGESGAASFFALDFLAGVDCDIAAGVAVFRFLATTPTSMLARRESTHVSNGGQMGADGNATSNAPLCDSSAR